MEPSSAKENAPKIERTAPTIHAAKTTETLLPSRAISAGFRKIPVPIMVPTTMAAEAQAPRPRTNSRRFSAIFHVSSLVEETEHLPTRARYIVPLRAPDPAHDPTDCKRHASTDEDIPCKRYGRETKNTQDGSEAREHANQGAACAGAAIEGAEQEESQQAAEGKRGHGQPGFQQRAPFHEAEAHEHEAPEKSHTAREAQELRRFRVAAAQTREIEDA